MHSGIVDCLLLYHYSIVVFQVATCSHSSFLQELVDKMVVAKYILLIGNIRCSKYELPHAVGRTF